MKKDLNAHALDSVNFMGTKRINKYFMHRKFSLVFLHIINIAKKYENEIYLLKNGNRKIVTYI